MDLKLWDILTCRTVCLNKKVHHYSRCTQRCTCIWQLYSLWTKSTSSPNYTILSIRMRPFLALSILDGCLFSEGALSFLFVSFIVFLILTIQFSFFAIYYYYYLFIYSFIFLLIFILTASPYLFTLHESLSIYSEQVRVPMCYICTLAHQFSLGLAQLLLRQVGWGVSTDSQQL